MGNMTCFTKLLEGLRPTAREVGEVRGLFTGVKKLEEQESAVNEASCAITCKDDHEEEIMQFDGETVKKKMINVLSTVENVKITTRRI